MMDSLEYLQSKQAIADSIYRYCRAMDRMDKDLLSTVFHPGADVDYPTFTGPYADMVDHIWNRHLALSMQSHQVTNLLIELDGGGRTAVSEAYVTAAWWRRGAPGPEQTSEPGSLRIIRGRYLDRWSVDGSKWAIDHRRCVIDISTEWPVTGSVGAGRRDQTDPSYGFFETSPTSRLL
jgi:hypothetical protein